MRSSAIQETALGLRSGSPASHGETSARACSRENARVKENQKILLCKRSGGDTDARCGHGVRVGVECGTIGKVSSHRGRVMGPADLAIPQIVVEETAWGVVCPG